MLVLSRKQYEKIIIAEDIVITVVEIQDGRVRIGIEAPKDIPVHRQEVWLSIREEERAKAQQQSPPSQVS